MGKKIALKVEKREEMGRKMRSVVEDRIPAVVYGTGMKSIVLWVEKAEFIRAFSESGKNTVIELKINKDEALNVLVHEYQVDKINNDVIHIDFIQVRMDEFTEAEVPLVFVGESAAVKSLGGTLVKSFDFVNVRALPADLPSEIEIDLSKIVTFEDHITTNDIKLKGEVELVLDEKSIIASVMPPRTNAEMEALDEEVNADVSKVEGAAEDVVEENSEEGKKEEK